jgi:hypothetical protein
LATAQLRASPSLRQRAAPGRVQVVPLPPASQLFNPAAWSTFWTSFDPFSKIVTNVQEADINPNCGSLPRLDGLQIKRCKRGNRDQQE